MAAALCLLLCGCGGSSSEKKPNGPGAPAPASASDPAGADDKSSSAPPAEPYQAPPFHDSAFHSDQASGENGALIDLSALADGYVGVSCSCEDVLKFQVIKEETYTSDLKNDGSPAIFPLQMGNGSYTFRVLKNIAGTKYAMLYSTEAEVLLTDEFQPYLRPNNYINYTRESSCVKKAAELASMESDEIGVIGAGYDYIVNGVVYDYDKYNSTRVNYLPDLEQIYQSGKGICIDYAALAAAMLRSQGIPVKMIFGYVSPNGLYHAWNVFYTEETGWVSVEFKAEAGDWTRIDLTFSANGTDADYIGDGDNYSDTYFY